MLLLHPSGSREPVAVRLVVWKHPCHEYFHKKEQTRSTDSFLGTLLPVLPAPEEEGALPGAGPWPCRTVTGHRSAHRDLPYLQQSHDPRISCHVQSTAQLP